jgi:hypothetical protein
MAGYRGGEDFAVAIQVKRFNWVQRATTWEYAQAWREHRSAMAQKFQEDGAALSSAFASAQNNLSGGMAALAAQAAIQRARKQLAASRNHVNLSA